jgi:hypothetical protein
MSYIVQESLVQKAIYTSRIIRTGCLYYMHYKSVRYRVFMSYNVQESSVQSVIYSRVSFYDGVRSLIFGCKSNRRKTSTIEMVEIEIGSWDKQISQIVL